MECGLVATCTQNEQHLKMIQNPSGGVYQGACSPPPPPVLASSYWSCLPPNDRTALYPNTQWCHQSIELAIKTCYLLLHRRYISNNVTMFITWSGPYVRNVCGVLRMAYTKWTPRGTGSVCRRLFRTVGPRSRGTVSVCEKVYKGNMYTLHK